MGVGRRRVGGETHSTLLLSCVGGGQEELAVLRRQLEGRDGEIRRTQDETCFKAAASSSPDPAERGGKSENHGSLGNLIQRQTFVLSLKTFSFQ